MSGCTLVIEQFGHKEYTLEVEGSGSVNLRVIQHKGEHRPQEIEVRLHLTPNETRMISDWLKHCANIKEAESSRFKV